jgi:hypothetical protein
LAGQFSLLPLLFASLLVFFLLTNCAMYYLTRICYLPINIQASYFHRCMQIYTQRITRTHSQVLLKSDPPWISLFLLCWGLGCLLDWPLTLLIGVCVQCLCNVAYLCGVCMSFTPALHSHTHTHAHTTLTHSHRSDSLQYCEWRILQALLVFLPRGGEHTHTHTHTQTHRHTHICAHIHTVKHTQTRTHTHTHSNAPVTRTHTDKTRTHTYMHQNRPLG